MAVKDFKNRSVDLHDFAMVPRADIPRSTFKRQFTHKTTFDANYLIPVFVDEVLPGDTFALKMTGFARVATPIAPIMDNLYLDSFFFFVPNRLVWSDWRKFMGEQDNPADSISFTIPQIVINNASGFVGNASLYDYFGIPTSPQVNSGTMSINALPFRCYNLIWNQWFRDENLKNSVGFGATNGVTDFGDGPDPMTNYSLLKRAKAHDYFTSALPWTQKGGVAVTVPIGGQAIVKTSASAGFTGAQSPLLMNIASSGANPTAQLALGTGSSTSNQFGSYPSGALPTGTFVPLYPTNLYADLSTATSVAINQLRQSFQIQRLLERDARGGTRYTEIVRAHFGVISPDARLQRPEYLGGGSVPINFGAVPQTSATGLTGGTTPAGNLSAFASLVAHGHGFVQSFTEHGHIIGLVNVRADITYQQGLRKLWSRSTRYDFYFPAFAMLGEQAILNQEIYPTGAVGTGAAQDQGVFGYQERWAEYRYLPSMITGNFRSIYSQPLDFWHAAEKLTSLPTLGSTFIDQNTPMARLVAAVSVGQTFLFDGFFDVRSTRPMPMFSVPGLIDHF